MMLDEAINILKSDNEYNKSIGCDISYEEQLLEWLEELKAIKEKGRYVQGNKAGQKIGYRNAIDDFVRFASTMPTVEEKEYIRGMSLEEMAEQLKAGDNNGT